MHGIGRFFNALAILIVIAQSPQLQGVGWELYAMVALGLAIIYILPKFTKVLPSSLVAIANMTALYLCAYANVSPIGDMGELPASFYPLIPCSLPSCYR